MSEVSELSKISELYKIFPLSLREKINRLELPKSGVTEIRLRAGGPVALYRGKEEFMLKKHGAVTQDLKEAYITNANEIKEMMEYISNFSIYAYEDELRQGFITLQGGHRVGVCGKVVMADGKIRTIRNISCLNIRIAREKKGCANGILPYLHQGNRLYHTLLVSPPGCGKTTMLRDIIRSVSDGFLTVSGKKTGVVDERSELAACHYGVPQNDVGRRTDVLDGCPKVLGMELLLRSMSPEVIAVDELGGAEDIAMVKKSIYSGCTILATAHGDTEKEWFSGGKAERVEDIPFERYVFLKSGAIPGQVEGIYDSEGNRV